MKKKARLVMRVGKKAAKKILREGPLTKYKNRTVFEIAVASGRYAIKNGPKAFVSKVKQEIVKADNRFGSLSFPNGLVSGVDSHLISEWYKVHARKVTIVIPSYNDFDLLVPLVESLKQTTDPKFTKVIIVDDYCQPDNQEKLKTLADSQIKVVFREQNGGFAVAVDTGMRQADQSHDVILLNSDMVAHKGWLEALQYGAYEFGVDTGIVGPKLLYPDGRIQSAGSYRNTEVPEFFDHYYRFQDSNYGPANIPQYCLGVTGACMYLKREFLTYVGGIDVKFNFAFEDMDICLRGWEKGYRTLYFPASVLTHKESATRALNKTISAKEKQSIEYFWTKWSKWFDNRKAVGKNGQPRIIFVLQTMGMSGGIKIVFEHALRLQERGFDIEVWGLDSKGVPWSFTEKLKIRSFKNYDRLVAALAPEEAIKVATWWETAFPVWLASVKKGIAVYFIQEIESWFYPDNVVAQATVVSCYRKEFKNMTTSQYNYEEITALGLKATPIPCGYDSDTYFHKKNTSRENNVMLGVGRTFFQKNFKFTFDAWKLLGEKRPAMWLFGIEPQMSKLDDRITYFNRPDDNEVNDLYNKATIFVQTSRHEGFSLPPLEAMAAGCPVICTDSHGNRDFCVPNKNCILVEHDNVEQLSKAIKRLMSNPALRQEYAREGLKTAKNYRWDTVINKVEDFYRSLANVK